MSKFLAEVSDVRVSLRFCFLLKKTPAESHRMLVEAYGSHALSETACREWFRKFESGEFSISNRERGRPLKKFDDNELEALLNGNNTLTQKELAKRLNVTQKCISERLKAMGRVRKIKIEK